MEKPLNTKIRLSAANFADLLAVLRVEPLPRNVLAWSAVREPMELVAECKSDTARGRIWRTVESGKLLYEVLFKGEPMRTLRRG